MRNLIPLCLCLYLLGCSATHMDPAANSLAASSGSSASNGSQSSSGSSGSGSGSSGSGSSSAVNVIAPSGSSAVSPVHYVATASTSCSGGIASMGIYTAPSQLAYVTNGASLDTNIILPTGTYNTTVQTWDHCGGTAKASVALSVLGSGRTFSNIEQMSGWYIYPDQGNPVCSSGPSMISSPSLDGTAGKFYLGPTGSYNNCLWPLLLGSSQTATHFILDTHYRLSDPALPQGVEFSSNKHIGTNWYKFSVQCSYSQGIFSVWDTAGAHWSPTSIPCRRPALNAWDHLTVNTAISNGKAVFLSLTFNGVTYPINQSFYPATKPNSYSYGVHFQMDGNKAGDAYETYVDQLTYTAW
jgi:hypothetical protein